MKYRKRAFSGRGRLTATAVCMGRAESRQPVNMFGRRHSRANVKPNLFVNLVPPSKLFFKRRKRSSLFDQQRKKRSKERDGCGNSCKPSNNKTHPTIRRVSSWMMTFFALTSHLVWPLKLQPRCTVVVWRFEPFAFIGINS